MKVPFGEAPAEGKTATLLRQHFTGADSMYLRPGIPVKKEHVRGRAQMIEWQHLDADRMYAERRKLVLGVGAVEFSGDESITSACEAVFSCPRLFGPRACDLRSSQRRGAER